MAEWLPPEAGKKANSMFYVYILKSLKNDKNYVGMTSRNTRIRLREHNLGKNHWVQRNKPFRVVYYEEIFCQEDAVNREKFLKSGVGRKLVKLIVDNF